MPGEYEIPNLCPACGQGLVVSELHCPGCQATLKGEFAPGPLARLSREQQQFMLVFVRNRGNLREVERELGLSYPTVRARLDQLVSALSPERTEAGKIDTGPQCREILAALDCGDISVEEAVTRLKAETKARYRRNPSE